jgi:N-acetylglucosaminyldiphosphoundecaprenol N-acetyl-beta-D-mannosaminyltransferase
MLMQTGERVYLLGVGFHLLERQGLLAYILAAAGQPRKTVIAHVNAHALNIAYGLPWYRAFFNQADLVFCDGFGVLLGARMLGHQVAAQQRMTCPDYIEELAQRCAAEGRSLFLLAGKPEVVQQAVAKLQAAAPGLRIAGHHGYFAKSGPENDAVVAQINAFQPDILYLGFGMPLQEQWVSENKERVAARVFLPLGACLDYYTGTVYRAPRWATDRGLEWLSRLLAEPRRLWRRYIVGNPLFLWRVLRQRFGLLARRDGV